MAVSVEKYYKLCEKSYEKQYGKVVKVVGLTVESIGPDVKLNDVCYITSSDKSK